MVGDVLTRMMANVRVDDEPGQMFVLNSIDSVTNDTQNVKTRKNGLR